MHGFQTSSHMHGRLAVGETGAVDGAHVEAPYAANRSFERQPRGTGRPARLPLAGGAEAATPGGGDVQIAVGALFAAGTILFRNHERSGCLVHLLVCTFVANAPIIIMSHSDFCCAFPVRTAEVLAKGSPSPSDADGLQAHITPAKGTVATSADTALEATTPAATDAATNTGIPTKFVATPTPKRPFKKRKVAGTPARNATPQQPKKKARKQRSKSSGAAGADAATGSFVTTPTDPAVTPEQDRILTSRALSLSRAIEADPELYRAILLHMALGRETPRKKGGGAPDHKGGNASQESGSIGIGKRRGNQYVEGVSSLKDNVITDGFFWKDVPELESILQQNMEEYYEMRYVKVRQCCCV